ncbi:hypothetical protein ACFQ4L_10355 [Lapidilactobacillus mulanensis]|uniref:Uncharacterized protein n=1 Tax=Lapidilactobacillus mulanensis TaxID=2485999 RepID=A0ABW4DPB1_9LACO|nr:hypothetical protein [Lapidilactobacillus mulanensis]
MHLFLGFTIAEWGGIIAIIAAIYGVAVRPINEHLSRLSDSIDQLNQSSRLEHKEFDRRLDIHDQRLVKHGAELDFLYELNHLKRKRDDEYED